MRIRRVFIVLAILALLAAAAGLFLYWWLQPARHFRSADIPVLAVPDQQSATSGPHSAAGRSSEALHSGVLGNRPPERQNPDNPGSDQVSLNILVLGIDARGKEDSRTDVMMLAKVNVDRNTVDLVSIPRDTRVQLPGVGFTKINHAHLLGELQGGNHGGTKASLQAVSNLCGCSINYYIKTNFAGFEHFINTLGGLEVSLPAPVKLTYAHRTLPAGKQVLNGDTALKLVQERKSLSEGDRGRQSNQALVLKSVLRTLVKPANLTRLPELIQQVRQDILDTNLEDGDILSLSLLAKEMGTEDIKYHQIPGHSDKLYDPLVKKELYYWIPDLAQLRQIYMNYIK
ncbi:LCP family protein [Paenibacillus tuaregi]|uniref:LCP family protein n=1 Tax=Paenibacillus tuaregi TaxID=1816681 RepID=UPI0008392DC1|nr:LCP family protein [Paenibacillus tuaregi]